jgi:hypothetical protein
LRVEAGFSVGGDVVGFQSIHCCGFYLGLLKALVMCLKSLVGYEILLCRWLVLKVLYMFFILGYFVVGKHLRH